MKKVFFFVFVVLTGSFLLSAQDRASLVQMAQNPRTVTEYFIACPYLTYSPVGERFGIGVSEKASDLAEYEYLSKAYLVQGLNANYEDPAQNLVVDQANGYFHVTAGDDDLTLVYYERADAAKSRIVAFRHQNNSGQFSVTTWAFFDVKGSAWTKIQPEAILPAGFVSAFFPSGLSQKEKDYLALSSWDIELPRLGTSARLIPDSYESDLDSATRRVTVPGTSRTVTQGEYWDWFNKIFVDDKGQSRSLELLWNKKTGRFDAGKVDAKPIVPIQAKTARGIDEAIAHPQNVWEYFLSNPELQKDTRDGLVWNPLGSEDELSFEERKQSFVEKQDLFGSEGLGNLIIDELRGGPLLIDLSNGYLNVPLIALGPATNDGGPSPTVVVQSTTLTLVYFQKADAAKTRIVGYRLWEDREDSKRPYNGPKTEHNRIAVAFYTPNPVNGMPWHVEPESLIPLDAINKIVVDPKNPKAQALQANVIWDVAFPRYGTTIELTPWRIAYLGDEEKRKLLSLFGSDAALQKAFEDFKRQYYSDQVITVSWNKAKGSFDDPKRGQKKTN